MVRRPEQLILSLRERPNRGSVVRKHIQIRGLYYGHKPHIYKVIYLMLEKSARGSSALQAWSLPSFKSLLFQLVPTSFRDFILCGMLFSKLCDISVNSSSVAPAATLHANLATLPAYSFTQLC